MQLKMTKERLLNLIKVNKIRKQTQEIEEVTRSTGGWN